MFLHYQTNDTKLGNIQGRIQLTNFENGNIGKPYISISCNTSPCPDAYKMMKTAPYLLQSLYMVLGKKEAFHPDMVL